ncbi:MAG: 50S ribosomal protein L21 [Oscillospiraceae bacterium]|nr:50S ribosomal protein L21 [Oscillospiraceae bacterium]
MYAVIKTGGKQYKVSQNDEIFVERLNAEEGAEVSLTDIVALHNGKKLIVDSKTLSTANVVAKVLKNGKARKITVFTYKPKKNEKRKLGHRQLYTKLQIISINEA